MIFLVWSPRIFYSTAEIDFQYHFLFVLTCNNTGRIPQHGWSNSGLALLTCKYPGRVAKDCSFCRWYDLNSTNVSIDLSFFAYNTSIANLNITFAYNLLAFMHFVIFGFSIISLFLYGWKVRFYIVIYMVDLLNYNQTLYFAVTKGFIIERKWSSGFLSIFTIAFLLFALTLRGNH